MSKIKLVDEVAKDTFGRTHTEAKEKGICVSCGVIPESFRDVLSEKEWRITLLCQKCQDDLYGVNDVG